jgi:hypothetical protein
VEQDPSGLPHLDVAACSDFVFVPSAIAAFGITGATDHAWDLAHLQSCCQSVDYSYLRND